MTTRSPVFVLASASPRRRELLQQIGFQPELWPADIDETPLSDEPPEQYVKRMAREKLDAAWSDYMEARTGTSELVMLASDTSVVCGDCILGKPESESDFKQMMRRLSGREHQVLTSVCVQSGRLESVESGALKSSEAVVITRVTFKALSDRDIDEYWRTGEPADKAGGYGIQGRGAILVDGIQGSYSNVVGLPLKETVDLLAEHGLDVWESSTLPG